jgi:hypothetical protein
MTSGQILVGQGATLDPTPQTVGGDLTCNNLGQFGLINSGVTAGTYGNSGSVAQVIVDATGRVLGASNVAISAGTGITSVVIAAGPFLTGGTITSTGTITGSGTPVAHGIVIGAGTAAVTSTAAMTAGQLLVGQGSTVDPAPETLSGDATLNSGGTLALINSGVTAGTYGSAVNVAQIVVDAKGRVTSASNVATAGAADHGSVLNSGTIQSDLQGTIAGGGHITYSPTSGVSNVLINGGTAATTLDIAAPNYVGQHLRAQYKNGATAEALNLGTTCVFGSTVSSYTSTATAATSDFLQFIGANASQWAVVAIAQGYTV